MKSQEVTPRRRRTMKEGNGTGRAPEIKCEECDEPMEYLCAGCDRQFCAEHYAKHVCQGPVA